MVYLIVITLNEGLAVAVVAQTQKVHRDTVYRIAEQFRERGELGLLDSRANNGTFRYHTGDDLPFVWKRVNQQTTSSRKGRK